MPISSAEIAALNGAYHDQTMARMAYAHMNQGLGTGFGAQSDAIVGSAMNRAYAVGAPVLQGAASILGVDPLGIGLRVGAGALAAGAGLGPAALIGGAVALPVAAGYAAAQYAGEQMYTGAQQQQVLNQTLRSSYQFRNTANFGRGFSGADMASIGGALRELSHTTGPGGELTSMRELTGLAGAMGTMGFAQGVRDVRAFTSRFKEMLGSLRSIAKDLGTTLDSAMQFAAESKDLGLFGLGQASRFAQLVRGTGAAGNLATSEITGAAFVGSQIARSVGGLGRQGAMAGVQTLGQIGMAKELGILSEEDIYNVTGLTGAEGRQAFAGSALGHTARFLKTGRGRRLLASIAGKDGSLDEAAVQQLLSGGMTIGETMRLDAQNLAKVGRANFIRNEGRLRGAAMERFGGFLPALQLMEWAQGRGIDIHDMDDRAMLFAQRQLGMGRDELDQTVKMAQHLPELMDTMSRGREEDAAIQKVLLQRKQQGLEGVKNRLHQAREAIDGKLQKVGQDLFTQGTDMVERFFAGLLGTYVQTVSKDIDDAYRSAMMGGAAGRSSAERVFGVGGAGMGSAARGALAGAPSLGATPGRGLAASLHRGASGNLEEIYQLDHPFISTLWESEARRIGGETVTWLLHGESDAAKWRRAGFDPSGLTTDQAVRTRMNQIAETRRAAAAGYDERQVALGAKHADWIRGAYAMDRIAGEGDHRIKSFGEELARRDPELHKEWAKKSQAEKAQMIANLERGAGIGRPAQLAAHYGLPDDLLGDRKGGFATETDENKAHAGAVLGDRRSTLERVAARLVRTQARIAASGLGVITAIGGKSSLSTKLADGAEELVGRISGSHERDQAAGRFLKSERFRDYAVGLLSTDDRAVRQTRKQIEDRIYGLAKSEGTDEREERTVLQRLLHAREYADLVEKTGNAPTAEEERALAQRLGTTVDQMKRSLGGIVRVADERQRTDLAAELTRRQGAASKGLDQLRALGIVTDKGLSEAKRAELQKIGPDALRYAEASIQIQTEESRFLGTADSADADRATLLRLWGKGGAADQRRQALESISVADKRRVAASLGGTTVGAEAASSAALQARVQGGLHRRGTAGILSDLLGTGLSKDDLKGLDFSTDEKAKAAAARLAGAAGVSGQDILQELALAGSSLAKGKTGVGTEALRRVLAAPELIEAQKKKRQEQQESDDPLLAAVKRNGEQANKFLEALVRSNKDAVAKLDELNKEQKKDPEKKS